MSLGLFLAQKNFPDLILCEAGLLEGDGYSLLESIKSDEELASIPVVFVIAEVDKLASEQIQGASFLLKIPFEEATITLRSKLEGLIQSRLLNKKDRPIYSPE